MEVAFKMGPILKLIFYSHRTLRIFRMCKSLKATYTFSQKIKLTYLTAKKAEKLDIFSLGVVITKIGVQYCGAKLSHYTKNEVFY